MSARRQAKYSRRSGGCQVCRAWRLECDGAKPCSSCADLGLTCDSDSAASSAIMLAPDIRKGGPGFHRYLKQLEILVPSDKWPQQYAYYFKGALQVAQDDSTILNALLCKVVLNELAPGDPIPKTTIQHYSKSLARPILKDIRLLLMVTNMYIDIEMFLIHWKNVDTLISSAFAILYTMRTFVSTRYRRDMLFYYVGLELLRLTAEIHKDCRIVPVERWTWLNELVLQIGKELRLPQGCIIEIQMIDLIYRMGQQVIDVKDLRFRITAWDHIRAQYRKTIVDDSLDATFFNGLSWRFGMPRLWWNSYLWYTQQDESAGEYVKESVEERTKMWENLTEHSFLSRGFGPRSVSRHINHAILHLMVGLNWYVRDPSIAERLVKVIERLRPWIPHADRVIGYMRVLAATPFTEKTALESETLGLHHRTFLRARDIHRVAFRLFEEPCPPSLRELDGSQSQGSERSTSPVDFGSEVD